MTTTEISRPAPTDEAAIAGLTQKVVAAWARADAEAFGSVFTDDGTMILPGVLRDGRRSIVQFMREAFGGPYRGTQVTGTPISLRFLAPDVGLLLTAGGVVPAGQSEPTGDTAIRASWLAVKRDGEWKLAAYQNSPRD